MKTKWLAVGTILLFIAITVIPSYAQDAKTPQSPLRGNWLYVGGSGPGNYTRIQDAIDNASDGDTVYVYAGIYLGNIVINESIALIGENKNTTIIDENTAIENPQLIEANIYIFIDSVNINGFTIQNCNGCGIFLGSSHVIISNNIFLNNTHGIHFYMGTNHNVIIMNNIITNNLNGIYTVAGCTNNTISKNIITNNNRGILISQYSRYNNIFYNSFISNKECGIIIEWGSLFNTVSKNTFLTNGKHASFRVLSSRNTWEENYWDKPRVLPFPIIGSLGLFIQNWVNFDWHPAKEPYDIP